MTDSHIWQSAVRAFDVDYKAIVVKFQETPLGVKTAPVLEMTDSHIWQSVVRVSM